MLNYDPDDIPNVTEEQIAAARAMGLCPVAIMCDRPGARIGDLDFVHFMAFVDCVPRIGENIDLQDGKTCKVIRVDHKVTKVVRNRVEFMSLVPNVYAVVIHEVEKSPDK